MYSTSYKSKNKSNCKHFVLYRRQVVLCDIDEFVKKIKKDVASKMKLFMILFGVFQNFSFD